MNIKQSIITFILTFGVSFNAFSSQLYEITQYPWNGYTVDGLSLGMVATEDAFKKTVLGSTVYHYGEREGIAFSSSFWNNGAWYLGATWCEGKYCSSSVAYLKKIAACPSGQVIDPISGKCVPQCGENEEINPDSGECEFVPFCDRPSTDESLFAAEQECAAQNGIFSFECSNGDSLLPEGLTTRCTQPNHCVIGMPNWPECLGDIDPTDPVDPPSGGFDPNPADPVNPNVPSFDKDNADSVTPDDTTDKALLQAIQNANKDANQAASAINKDMNQGFADLETAVNTVNKTNEAIGTAIASQNALEHQMFEANKELMLQNTGEIKNLGSNLTGALNEQTAAITDAIGKINGQDDGSVTASGCSNFSCDGDAATCYMAKKHWESKCSAEMEKQNVDTALTNLSSDLKTISEGSVDEHGAFKGVYANAETTADAALDAYTQSNGFNFESGCPAPRTISPLGVVLTLDYQPFCDLAIIFRVFIMASASIASFLMIAKHI